MKTEVTILLTVESLDWWDPEDSVNAAIQSGELRRVLEEQATGPLQCVSAVVTGTRTLPQPAGPDWTNPGLRESARRVASYGNIDGSAALSLLDAYETLMKERDQLLEQSFTFAEKISAVLAK